LTKELWFGFFWVIRAWCLSFPLNSQKMLYLKQLKNININIWKLYHKSLNTPWITFRSPSIGVKPPGRSFSTVAKPLFGSLVCLPMKNQTVTYIGIPTKQNKEIREDRRNWTEPCLLYLHNSFDIFGDLFSTRPLIFTAIISYEK